MPSAVANSAAPEVGDDSGKFHADLANGLHAMAQPLTILRAAMEVLNLPPATGVDQRRYLEISATQLERTCRLFANVQDLVTARSADAQRTRLELWEIIGPLIEEETHLLQAPGVAIAVAKPETLTPILGDAGRTKQAVGAALEIAAELASRGDVIELRVSRSGGFVQLAVENTRVHGRRLDSSARLSLALAEANMLSQQGHYEFVSDPFRVSLALPIDKLTLAGSETVHGKQARETVSLH